MRSTGDEEHQRERETFKEESQKKERSSRRGKGMMGRLQKSRKPHPTRKIITILRHVSKEKRNDPSQRLDHKETRSSWNSEWRNSLYMHQVTGSRQNRPEKARKWVITRKLGPKASSSRVGAMLRTSLQGPNYQRIRP
ncbi:hypothetical protein PIB30_062985 [Stylosanthes scabra]|uniref:Uncharacterized protein n=1 Tax=Stylosanthes scabra TaxID=79078 RepID=A0ABU6QKS8_9FABA|nr:hypothetical protein [Stylosanthes scabra]